MFFKMGVSKNFAIFKKRVQRRCFPVNISKFLRISSYRTHPLAASIVSTKNISLPDSQMLKTMTNITTNLEHIFLNNFTDKKYFIAIIVLSTAYKRFIIDASHVLTYKST